MNRWEGKIAVVTGASAGIGVAIVEALAKAGVHVVALARRVQRIEQLAAALKDARGTVYPKRCDLSKEGEISATLKWVEQKLGGIDILINNAGYAKNIKIEDDDPDSFRHMINVNVLAMALTTKFAVASMKSRQVPGHIINVNSIGGHVVNAGQFPLSLYSTCKFGVTALSESVRQELASDPKNYIRVTNLSPGAVKSEFVQTAGLSNPEQFFENYPFLEPKDLANAVLFVLGAPRNVLVSELTIRHTNETL